MARKRGNKEGRTQVTTIRMTAENKYLAELAARAQRRTLSQYISCCVEDALVELNISPEDPEILDMIEKDIREGRYIEPL